MKRTQIESILKSMELVSAGKLVAHHDFIKVGLLDLIEICNGCGAKGKFDFVPDRIWGLWVGPVCNIHDFGYHVGTTHEDKAQADRDMLTNNLRAIEACSTWIMKPLRRQRALTYYSMVTDLGGPAFWAGK